MKKIRVYYEEKNSRSGFQHENTIARQFPKSYIHSTVDHKYTVLENVKRQRRVQSPYTYVQYNFCVPMHVIRITPNII